MGLKEELGVQGFIDYGKYLLNALPREALEQAGLLAGDLAFELSAEASAQQQRVAGQAQEQGLDVGGGQEEEEEDQEELYAEFGNLELKNDLAAGLFGSLGFDMDSLMACCAEA